MHVLSIQSHVVHGYVGNRIAVFTLQILGIEVDFINSVQFSNHTGYELIEGQALTDVELNSLYRGLVANKLNRYTHIITGYVGDASFLRALASVIRDIKTYNPAVKYYCDPVLGDHGCLYVPKELIEIYQEEILPLADVVLPNQFEAELLTNCKITDEASVWKCMNVFHSDFSVPTVVISSTDVTPDNLTDGELAVPSTVMMGYASRRSHLHKGDDRSLQSTAEERVLMRIPTLNFKFVGTGDLFTALTLAKLERSENQTIPTLKAVMEEVIGTMQAVLQRTAMDFKKSVEDTTDKSSCAAALELKIIQSVRDILDPPPGTYVIQL